MNRLATIFSADFARNLKSPFFWIWYVLLAWNAFLISNSNWIIRSVDTSVGTTKSVVNSEFALAFVFTLMMFLIMGIFIAITAGTPLLRDSQYRIGEIIHATPLTPAEYVWGKFLAAAATTLTAIVLFVITLILLNDVIPNPASAEFHGPFQLRNYVMPVIAFMLPAALFLLSISFAIAVFTRKGFLVYLFPIAMIILSSNFLYAWYPPEASDVRTYVMQCLDPSGFRWLKQTWLIVDRGVDFYNTAPIQYDAGFIAGRLMYVALAVGLVALSVKRFASKSARIADKPQKPSKQKEAASLAPAALPVPTTLTSVSRAPESIISQTVSVLRFELKELFSQPWLLAVMVLISLLILLPDRGADGELHIMTRYTSGLLAAARMGPLSILICFLLMFTTAESLHRENASGLSPLYYSTPASTTALVTGKTLANIVVGIAATFICFLFLFAFLAIQNEAPLQIKPFLLLWGALMIPTFVFWCALIAALYSIARSRTAAYAVAIGVMFVSGWAYALDKHNWVTHWTLLEAVPWTDFGVLQLDSDAVFLNRILYLALAVSLCSLAVLWFPRRFNDPNRRKPGNFLRKTAKFAAIIILPAAIAIILWMKIESGFEGRQAEKQAKDYWSRNVASFLNEPLPDRTFIDLDIRFEPDQRSFKLNGSYEFVNNQQKPLYRIPLTAVGYWSNLKWTLNGAAFTPENRSGMYVFNLEPPLQPQEKSKIGFSYSGIMLPGVSKNGGTIQLGEFILPSAVVLTGRNPWFVPVLGFVSSIGVDEKNRYEPEDPGPHYYEGITEGGIDRSLLNTRIRLDVPQDFTTTSMGVKKTDDVKNGRRITVWESDYPVRVFNVVASRFVSKQGKSATVYYNPAHPYAIDTMLNALDGSRHYYSEWYGDYVWRELRMSEFPGLSLYARGNPTNIFFSENIGFLTKEHMEEDIFFGMSAFAITAHEAAHQWWGHMLSPAEGPGAIVLAEGMANYATLCLLEQMQGEKQRQAAAKFMEQFYGEQRFVTSERPLNQSVFHRPADTTVIYDKGAWVFWMLRNLIGRDNMNNGLRTFIEKYHKGPDLPVLEDFVAHMREYAPDASAYEHFTQQWFFKVVIPEYRFMTKPVKINSGNMWEVKTRIKNVGNAQMPVEVTAISESQKSIVKISPGKDEEIDVLIPCNFEPERIVVDPDVNVLQLQRRAAAYRFK